MRTISCVALLLLVGLAPADVSSRAVAAETLTGKVVAVHDGDTLTALDAGKTQHNVRLHGIDPPETKPAFGTVARKGLADPVFGKVVDVEVVDKDRYGRQVGKVHVGGRYVKAEMVRQGLAWRYVQYNKRGEFAQDEQAARAARKGLWADANPVAPWEWRKSENERMAAR